jgi:hypothetical protein
MIHRHRSTLVVAALALLGGACEEVTAPELSLPLGARRFTPEPIFREWWAQVEACAGRQASFDAVSWYVVPGEVPFEAPGVPHPVLGYWHAADNRIVLLEWVPNRTSLVRHEALHAILQRADHPEEYFEERCAEVIDAPG